MPWTPRRPSDSCIRQNVCTSLRRYCAYGFACVTSGLHTSKRMHFIEDPRHVTEFQRRVGLHTSKRMHFIEETTGARSACCASALHTSKRMHFIEESYNSIDNLTASNLHTSKRMHFIEECYCLLYRGRAIRLAYVKTYALH